MAIAGLSRIEDEALCAYFQDCDGDLSGDYWHDLGEAQRSSMHLAGLTQEQMDAFAEDVLSGHRCPRHGYWAESGNRCSECLIEDDEDYARFGGDAE